MNAPIVHVEFAGPDGELLENFYRELFGWEIHRESPGGHVYGRFSPEPGTPLTGGVRHEPEGHAEIVVYVAVPDVSDRVDRALVLGGGVRVPTRTYEGRTFAVIEDPAGNPVGLVQA